MSTLPIRYVGWMTRDLVYGPMLWMLGLMAITLWLNPGINGTPLVYPDRLITLFVVLATAGMISRDFAGGYHRTLFAKPISPPLYYLQRWLLGALGVIAVTTLFAFGTYIRFDLPLQIADLIAQTALAYLLIGGVIFFLSTITRRDWLIAVLLLSIHSALGSVVNNALWKSALSALTYRLAEVTYSVLPPFHLVGANQPMAWNGSSAHAALYGVGLMLAGLAILRWRALGPGWRE